MKPAVLGPSGTSLAAFAALTVSLGIHGTAQAKTVTVDAGCTLPDAVSTVNSQVAGSGCAFSNQDQPNDVILLPAGPLTLTAPLELSSSVTVQGSPSSERSTPLAAMTTDSFFLRVVDPTNTGSVNVTFDNLNIERQTGNPNVTGIYAFGAVLTIQNAFVGGFQFSGVISDDSDVSISSSTIENNSSFWSGAGIQFNNPIEANFADGLQDLGGPTNVLALCPNSPALDQIPQGQDTFDQRGDGRRIPGTDQDIGAFELGPADLAWVMCTDPVAQ
ncbi:MAG: choice-of-anchor Q domain-containing protein [Deltaproteobacteria bacterium]